MRLVIQNVDYETLNRHRHYVFISINVVLGPFDIPCNKRN